MLQKMRFDSKEKQKKKKRLLMAVAMPKLAVATPETFGRACCTLRLSLRKILKVVCGVHCSSERNLSTFCFVHTKLRNRLLSASVKKLVFLKFDANKFIDGIEVDDFICYDK
uniref:Uncharacterized protein n=1 Tax=Romanomermis culicivorax TaxID=13658 RepID=A0A915JU10_ROMCU